MTTAAIEQGATPLPLYDLARYPHRILLAMAAVYESPELSHVPDGYIRLLNSIVTKIDLMNLKKPIFARRSVLAEESGKSIDNVGRGLKWFEDDGLISRKQVQNRGKNGSVGYIYPTDKLLKALRLLGFKMLNTKKPQAAADSDRRGSVPKNAAHENMPEDKTSQIGNVIVPGELTWLHTKGGLTGPAICKLMGAATKSGNKLSDVIAVGMKAIKGRVRSDLFAKLMLMIEDGKDYKFIRKQNEGELEQERIAERDKERLKVKAIEWVGRRFVNGKGWVYTVKEGGVVEQTINGKYIGSSLLSMKFLNDFEDGVLGIMADNGSVF